MWPRPPAVALALAAPPVRRRMPDAMQESQDQLLGEQALASARQRRRLSEGSVSMPAAGPEELQAQQLGEQLLHRAAQRRRLDEGPPSAGPEELREQQMGEQLLKLAEEQRQLRQRRAELQRQAEQLRNETPRATRSDAQRAQPNRPKCRCRCGCRRRPGRLQPCPRWGRGVGPGCCWDPAWQLCHSSLEQDFPPADDLPSTLQTWAAAL